MRQRPNTLDATTRRAVPVACVMLGIAFTGPAALADAAAPAGGMPGMYDPTTVVAAEFPAPPVAAPSASSSSPSHDRIDALPAAPAPVPASMQTADDTIVLHINLTVDDVRTTHPTAPVTETPTAQPEANVSPFDFSPERKAPAVLSVPMEGAPRKIEAQAHATPPAPFETATQDQVAATPAPTAVSAVIDASARPVDATADRPLADNPIRIGQSVVLGMTEPDGAACFDRTGAKRICVIGADWSPDMRPLFEVNSTLYRGAKAIARIDAAGTVEVVYAMFAAENFDRIAGHFALQFGAAERFALSMALVGNPKARNRVLRWTRLDADGSTVVLELRANDDLRDILPDESHGVVRLYRENDLPLFHDLQTTDFLLHVMRAGAS